MGRYVYKPLVTYFEGDPEEKKFEFIRAYKDSLTSGELLVDLYNYDIYVANNGMEYPVPSTPELKKEIIDWIESDEGPLGSYQVNDLINSQVDKDSPSNIENKKERINNLLNQIELYKKECTKQVDDNENMIKRIDRETDIWYNDLSKYVYNKIYINNLDGSDVVNVLYYVLTKYIDLYQRIENVNRNIEFLKELYQDKSNNLPNYLYEDNIKKLFKELVDNKVAIDHKVDIDEIKKDGEYIVPKYEFSISINNNNQEFYDYLNDCDLITNENPDEIFVKRKIEKDDISNNIKITITNEKE